MCVLGYIIDCISHCEFWSLVWQKNTGSVARQTWLQMSNLLASYMEKKRGTVPTT